MKLRTILSRLLGLTAVFGLTLSLAALIADRWLVQSAIPHLLCSVEEVRLNSVSWLAHDNREAIEQKDGGSRGASDEFGENWKSGDYRTKWVWNTFASLQRIGHLRDILKQAEAFGANVDEPVYDMEDEDDAEPDSHTLPGITRRLTSLRSKFAALDETDSHAGLTPSAARAIDTEVNALFTEAFDTAHLAPIHRVRRLTFISDKLMLASIVGLALFFLAGVATVFVIRLSNGTRDPPDRQLTR